MKNESILQAAEVFREKVQLAQAGSNRSQDILKAIREFLAELSSSIPNTEAIPSNARQEIIRGFEEIQNRIGTK